MGLAVRNWVTVPKHRTDSDSKSVSTHGSQSRSDSESGQFGTGWFNLFAPRAKTVQEVFGPELSTSSESESYVSSSSASTTSNSDGDGSLSTVVSKVSTVSSNTSGSRKAFNSTSTGNDSDGSHFSVSSVASGRRKQERAKRNRAIRKRRAESKRRWLAKQEDELWEQTLSTQRALNAAKAASQSAIEKVLEMQNVIDLCVAVNAARCAANASAAALTASSAVALLVGEVDRSMQLAKHLVDSMHRDQQVPKTPVHFGGAEHDCPLSEIPLQTSMVTEGDRYLPSDVSAKISVLPAFAQFYDRLYDVCLYYYFQSSARVAQRTFQYSAGQLRSDGNILGKRFRALIVAVATSETQAAFWYDQGTFMPLRFEKSILPLMEVWVQTSQYIYSPFLLKRRPPTEHPMRRWDKFKLFLPMVSCPLTKVHRQ